MSEKIKIAILGLGVVGGGVYDLIKKNDLPIEVVKVFGRSKDKALQKGLPEHLWTENFDEIIKSNADVVVETLGGIDIPTKYVLTALENKKSVVTANKAMLSPNYKTILETAKNNGVSFKYEATVAGTIPVINVLENSLNANKIIKIEGILNGTANYILTKMSEEGWEYGDALKKAQDLGFAESDPTDDVEGIDTANKLSILISLTTGKYVSVKDLSPKGISGLSSKDFDEAKSQGCVIKLLGTVSFENDEMSYFVMPTYLNKEHPLASVRNEYNGILITGNASDDIMLYGKGAGAFPTASAVVSDILSITKES